jgi:DNA end-binding protein Ku
MAPVWKGSLSFGLVHIPVQLQAAVRSSDRISFRQLHKDDHAPIRLKRVCEAEGVEVPWDDIVKGYEYEKGRFVVFTPEELKSVALPSSRVIDILEFVPNDEVDPRYFETPYYVMPQAGGERPYALLREAVRDSGMLGIGKVTLREGSHHLAALRVVGDALVLELMRFASEIVPVESLSFPPADRVRKQELAMATQLVGNLAESFEPEKYHDEYQQALRAMIDRKLQGEDVVQAPVNEPAGTPVVDLLARLKESVAMGKKGAPRGETRGETRRATKAAKPAAASEKKPAAKTTAKSAAKRPKRKTA